MLFLGYLDRKKELPDCYRAANVFVFSSCTETQGLVLLEAMAQAVPVVALAEMGTRDVLRQDQGALIPGHDVDGGGDDLADEIAPFGRGWSAGAHAAVARHLD